MIRAVAAVLAADGVIFYDTVARTALSRIVYLGLFQRLPATRIMPPDGTRPIACARRQR